jgi:septal ring factor EnvC (AmiA/AmiB activator)
MRRFNRAANASAGKNLPENTAGLANLLNFCVGTSPALGKNMFDHLEELEDIQAEVRRVIAMLRENEVELTAEGFDVEESIAEIRDQFAQTVKTFFEADHAHDEYLHACADLADAENAYYQNLCELLDPVVKEHPKHPLAKQWQQLRPILASQSPRNN